jgi:hypothetical protein
MQKIEDRRLLADSVDGWIQGRRSGRVSWEASHGGWDFHIAELCFFRWLSDAAPPELGRCLPIETTYLR